MTAGMRVGLRFAAALAAGFAVAGLALFVFRKPILQAATETYFASQGAPGHVRILHWDRTEITAQLTLGEGHELDARRVTLSLDPTHWLPYIASVRVNAPKLHARFDGRGLSFGSLQHLVDSLSKAPRSKGGWTDRFVSDPLPVVIDDAVATVDTPRGPFRLSGRLVLSGSEIRDADLHVTPLELHFEELAFRLEDASLRAAQGTLAFQARGAVVGAGVASSFGLNGRGHLANDGTLALDAHLEGSAAASEERAVSLLRPLPLLGTDPQTLRALSAAARAIRFTLSAHASYDHRGVTLTLLGPLSVASNSGAFLTIEPLGSGVPTLVFNKGGVSSAMTVRLAGRGLPAASLTIDNLQLTNNAAGGSLAAILHTTTTLDAGSLRGLSLSGASRVESHDGALRIVLEGCAGLRLGKLLVKGKAAISSAAARLCSDKDQPVFARTPTGWAMNARLRDASASLPGSSLKLGGVSADLALGGTNNGLAKGQVTFGHGRVLDLAKARRFEPIAVAGRLDYADNRWRGGATLESTRHRARLGTIAFVHDVTSGRGEALIDTRDLRFEEGRLSPADISPRLGLIARAAGAARFHGRVAWTPSTLTSGGVLDVDHLQFASPIGNAHGTSAHIQFVSLLPPRTAPDQSLSIEQVDAISPLRKIGVHFGFTPLAVEIGGASAEVADGLAKIDPLTFSFGEGGTLAGTLRLSQIDLGGLIASSNLGGHIHVQARVSGTIPFAVGNEGIRIRDGVVAATAPGRIAIARTLWSSGAALSSNAMQDFAYQALENLAFERLQGTINSLPKGRLGLILHIQGHYDPPKPSEARIGVFDLLRGQAFSKNIPLPSGTPIDLTLDTSLNFDELLRAYQAARSPTVSMGVH